MTSYATYYDALLSELRAVANSGTDPKSVAEASEKVARRYRDSLPLPGVFVTQREFFKDHFFRFQVEVRYYTAIVQAQATWPRGGVAEWKAFWIKESNRRYEAIEAYPALHTYWVSGTTNRDEELFAGDPDAARHYTEVIAEFVALSRYERYLEEAFQTFFTKEQP